MSLVTAWLRFGLLLVAAGLLVVRPAWALEPRDFEAWLEIFKSEAAGSGISPRTLETAFAGITPDPEVLALDRHQPEFTQTFWRYLDRRVTVQRIEKGRELLAKHRPLLEKIKSRYGVQPHFLVAFWGLETNFGTYTGDKSVIRSLATLAYDTRRSRFFRGELLQALKIIDAGHAGSSELMGSWAGATGQLQFMPSTFNRYAVDGDGDDRLDIWSSYPDMFASAANYLRSVGWRPKQIWGREVRLPAGFDLELAQLQTRKPIAEWQKLGVRRANGKALPQADFSASIVLPGGVNGPAFMVYDNFRAILVWNRSLHYALAVGHLSDQLIHLGPLLAKRPAKEESLRRTEVEELQGLLLSLGFNPGAPDGVLGSRTRAAIRAYQRQAKLPADGYPTVLLLDGLRRKATNQTGRCCG
jgi:membrane-bound lytic murein transglycosylase B